MDLVILKVFSNQDDSMIASDALRHHLCELCCVLEQLVKCQGAQYIWEALPKRARTG